MSSGFRRPFEVVDHEALMAAHAPAPEYFEGDYLLAPEEIERRQFARLKERAERAYAVPFFRRRWDAAGVGPRDIETLDDLSRFPTYRVDDIRRSIEANPPLGDFKASRSRGRRRNPFASSCLERRPALLVRRSTRTSRRRRTARVYPTRPELAMGCAVERLPPTQQGEWP